MKNTKNTSIIIGLIVVGVTLLIFLMGIPNGKKAIDYIALLFIIIAELSCFLPSFILKNTATQNTVLSPICYVYASVSILFSVIFKSAFADNISAFVTTHIIFMSIAVISYLASNKLVVDTIKTEDETILQKAVIDECEVLANMLCQDERFTDFKNQLDKIYNEIKYNDHVSDCKSSEILSVLTDIYNSENNDNTDELCKKAIRLINERNIIVKQLKRGGF